jgi:hypothetical protein
MSTIFRMTDFASFMLLIVSSRRQLRAVSPFRFTNPSAREEKCSASAPGVNKRAARQGTSTPQAANEPAWNQMLCARAYKARTASGMPRPVSNAVEHAVQLVERLRYSNGRFRNDFLGDALELRFDSRRLKCKPRLDRVATALALLGLGLQAPLSLL